MKLIYDIKAIPSGLDPANLTKMYEQHHIIFWDSDNGSKPKLVGDDGSELSITLVDTKGNELNYESYVDQWKDDEYWKRELHNCQHSPTYFFNNYGTTVYPATQKGIREYLLSIGLENIVADDNLDAEKKWELQKAKTKETTDKYTIEFLKERQVVVQAMKAKYEDVCVKLEEKLKTRVSLFDNKGMPLDEKKRISNLAEKIRRVSRVLPQYAAYRNSKGKWDHPMLYNTSYDILLQIMDDVFTVKDSE